MRNEYYEDVCNECGGEVYSDWIYCAYCGEEL